MKTIEQHFSHISNNYSDLCQASDFILNSSKLMVDVRFLHFDTMIIGNARICSSNISGTNHVEKLIYIYELNIF